MKKFLSIILCLAVVLGAFMLLASCGANDGKDTGKADDTGKAPADATPEIAVVTDVGQLMDKGFNQGTYEGAKAYAEAHGIGYKYYQPANGSDATDNDRIDAMKQAINNGVNADLATGVCFEAEAYVSCFTSSDRVEGMTAFVEKRPAEFKNE